MSRIVTVLCDGETGKQNTSELPVADSRSKEPEDWTLTIGLGPVDDEACVYAPEKECDLVRSRTVIFIHAVLPEASTGSFNGGGKDAF